MPELEEVTASARVHADNLSRDIKNATTRLEHVRLTQLAFEANRLVELLEALCNAEKGSYNV